MDSKRTLSKWFSASADWFVLHVKIYEERRVAERLQSHLDSERYVVFVPLKDRLYEKHGVKSTRRVPWLNGYVFIATTESEDECLAKVNTLIQFDEDVFKILYNGGKNDSAALGEHDREIMTAILNENFDVPALETVNVGERLEISDKSVFSGFGGQIIKVNNREHTATIAVEMLGRSMIYTVLLADALKNPNYKENNMGNLTERGAATLEQALTPDEALEYLKDEKNFRNAANGIRDWFAAKHPDVDAARLDRAFRRAMRTELEKPPTIRTITNWLDGVSVPEKGSAIKICFAIGLSADEANEFLFKVCKLNGFNFRKAEDVVFAYCLENKKSYADAERIISDYKKATENYTLSISDVTKRTRHLQLLFSELGKMPYDDFFDLLCDNKNNFIGYSLSAQRLFANLHDTLNDRLKNDIEGYNRTSKELYNNDAGGYPVKDITILSEVVFDNLVRTLFDSEDSKGEKVSRPKISDKTTLKEVADSFPRAQYITAMLEDAKTASESGYSRKTYILLFFANEVFKQENSLSGDIGSVPPKNSFYHNFYMKLNGDLFDCGYGLLHTANPFDWLILNCIRSLDKDALEYDTLQLFNDLLHNYIEA